MKDEELKIKGGGNTISPPRIMELIFSQLFFLHILGYVKKNTIVWIPWLYVMGREFLRLNHMGRNI